MPLDVQSSVRTIYIPDTSSLVENPDAIDRLLTDGNIVVLMHQVIEELGRLQASRGKSDGVRAAARTAARKLLMHRREGRIHHDIGKLVRHEGSPEEFKATKGGGYLAWEPRGEAAAPFVDPIGDNLILAGAKRVADIGKASGYETVMVSEDNNLLLKCDAVGLRAENLRYGKVELRDVNEVHQGHVELEISEETFDAYMASGDPFERAVAFDVLPNEVTDKLVWNTCAVLETPSGRQALLRANPEAMRLEDLRHSVYWDRKRKIYCPRPILGLTPRDPLQTFAMEFLLDPDVQLVVLDGPAGSGKTRFMVAAALYHLVGEPTSMRFSKGSNMLCETDHDNGLFLLRPEQPSSQYELGYLPGDYDTKVGHWLEPFFQHMRSLSSRNEYDFVRNLEERDKLHMLSTSMLRGLDIERSIVLVDELQNGDRHLAKTLMSRFCETSKVVLAGCLDPVQIDNPYVDWRSNALTRVKQTYAGFGPYVAQISLKNNYRGPISKKADEL
jgi:PhoH-like ATPase